MRLVERGHQVAVVALTTSPLISFIGAGLARWWRASFLTGSWICRKSWGLDGNHYLSASAAHGEVGRVVQQIQWARRESATADCQAATHLSTPFSKEALLPKLIAELELC